MNLLLAVTFSALSLFRTDDDTTAVTRLDEVVVTGTRTAFSLFQQRNVGVAEPLGQVRIRQLL